MHPRQKGFLDERGLLGEFAKVSHANRRLITYQIAA